MALVLTTAACAEAAPAASDASAPDGAAGPRALAIPPAWARLVSDDPWASEPPPALPCDPFALRDEGAYFEIDTRTCAAASVGQPALAAVRPGDRLRGVVWNLGLAAAEPAEGHVALSLDGHALLDARVPIPSPARVLELDLLADFDAPLGARLVFHVHNHGANSWRVAELRVETP